MIDLRVGFISSHLAADKLFPVNPRAITSSPKMSLVLEVIIDHRMKVYPCCAHRLLSLVRDVRPEGRNAHSKPQQDYQQTKCYNRADHVYHYRLCPGTIFGLLTIQFQFTWCFGKTFLLTYKFGTSCAIEMTSQKGVI